MKRTMLMATVALCFGWAPLVAAAEAPTAVVKLASVNRVLKDLRFLADLVGRSEEGKQAEALVKVMMQEKTGLGGIDVDRPMGAYSIIATEIEKSANILLVPIKDEKAFLELLASLGQVVKKQDDGFYSIQPDPLPVAIYFRFANGYVYATAPDKDALAKKNLIDPKKVFDASDGSLLSASWNLDQVPEDFKKIAIEQMEQYVASEKGERRPGESEAEHRLRLKTIDETARILASVIRDGQRVALRIDVDTAKEEMVAELSLSGKDGSDLSSSIGALGESKTRLSEIATGQSAMTFLLHVTLPEAVRQALAPAIDEDISKTLERSKDEKKRELGKKLFDALAPSLKAAELDLGFRVDGPTKKDQYTFLGGVKVKNGNALDAVFRELVKVLPEREQKMIHFDAVKAEGVGIHRLDAHKRFDAPTRQVLGDNPIYLALQEDVIWLSGGPDGLARIKRALKSKPVTAPLFRFDLSIRKLVPSMNPEARKQIEALAKRSFVASGDDLIRVEVGGGNSLKARASIKTPVVKFFAELANKKIDPFAGRR
ncbi:MAG: hypothetical protein KatS3mg105_3856 [Gemmatales bacterium]|nr:MAG: hypothetical protein KatS3mg105_3856 [Gemmatales bacterium]